MTRSMFLRVFQALQSLSANTTMEQDAVTMRMTLSFDLSR